MAVIFQKGKYVTYLKISLIIIYLFISYFHLQFLGRMQMHLANH